METLAFHLTDVDASKQQTFLANFTKQIHVHAVGGFGFTVETGDEVEAWQQFGQTTHTPNAAVFVDEPNRRLELCWITIQPIGFVNARVGRFQTKGQHSTIGEGFHKRLRDFL